MASPDWIEILGRPRPIEVDSLRILVVTHRLGTEPRGEPAARDFVRVVEGEELLALLDQLVRRPITAIYLLLDLFRRRPELAGRRAEMARRVRQLLAVDRQLRQPARRRRPWKSAADALEESRRRHPFEPPRWRRLDAPVAFLSSRGLMGFHLEEAVRGPAGGSVPPVQITYGLTEAGERLLEERAYPEDRDRTLVLQVCEALAELLPLVGPAVEDRGAPPDEAPSTGEALSAELAAVGRRLGAFCRQAQIPAERDPLPELFRNTFRERL